MAQRMECRTALTRNSSKRHLPTHNPNNRQKLPKRPALLADTYICRGDATTASRSTTNRPHRAAIAKLRDPIMTAEPAVFTHIPGGTTVRSRLAASRPDCFFALLATWHPRSTFSARPSLPLPVERGLTTPVYSSSSLAAHPSCGQYVAKQFAVSHSRASTIGKPWLFVKS